MIYVNHDIQEIHSSTHLGYHKTLHWVRSFFIGRECDIDEGIYLMHANATWIKKYLSRRATSTITYVPSTTKVEAVDKELKRDRSGPCRVTCTVKKSPIPHEEKFDKHHMDREFEIGDWVYLRLQLYQQTSLST